MVVKIGNTENLFVKNIMSTEEGKAYFRNTGLNPVLQIKSFIPEVLRFALAVYVGVNGFFIRKKPPTRGGEKNLIFFKL